MSGQTPIRPTPKSRTGRRELEVIGKSLGERDLAILRSVADHRFLTTSQIARLHFSNNQSSLPALRSANRTLARLKEQHLLSNLERRIGGVRAGSGSFVWTLGNTGARILNHGDQQRTTQSRYREYEPTSTFLEHHLAVAEVHLSLKAISTGSASAVMLSDLQLEPKCWRSYLGQAGEMQWLKPDLVATTTTLDFEDHWFLEVDRGTEPPSRIVRKCHQYQKYRSTGIEQRRIGVFPAVVWIVPSVVRIQSLQAHLKEIGLATDGLFWIITLDQLGNLIERGPQARGPNI